MAWIYIRATKGKKKEKEGGTRGWIDNGGDRQHLGVIDDAIEPRDACWRSLGDQKEGSSAGLMCRPMSFVRPSIPLWQQSWKPFLRQTIDNLCGAPPNAKTIFIFFVCVKIRIDNLIHPPSGLNNSIVKFIKISKGKRIIRYLSSISDDDVFILIRGWKAFQLILFQSGHAVRSKQSLILSHAQWLAFLPGGGPILRQ